MLKKILEIVYSFRLLNLLAIISCSFAFIHRSIMLLQHREYGYLTEYMTWMIILGIFIILNIICLRKR